MGKLIDIEAATITEAIAVMVNGPSGLMAVTPARPTAETEWSDAPLAQWGQRDDFGRRRPGAASPSAIRGRVMVWAVTDLMLRMSRGCGGI